MWTRRASAYSRAISRPRINQRGFVERYGINGRERAALRAEGRSAGVVERRLSNEFREGQMAAASTVPCVLPAATRAAPVKLASAADSMSWIVAVSVSMSTGHVI